MELIQSLITIVIFFAVLGILVIVHELGHFVTARLANVRVLEFGIGFPPRAKVLGQGAASPDDVRLVEQRRERSLAEARNDPELLEELLDEEPERATGTLYTLNWLPIGGFVKLEGEDGDREGDPRSFSSQPLLTRLWILVAGVLMNVLLAFVIFTMIAWLATPFVGSRVVEVSPNSPAATAGLQPGDTIVSVDGERYQWGGLLGTATPVDSIRSRAGETVVLGVVGAGGATRDVTVTLRPAAEITPQNGALGITRNDALLDETVSRSLPDAIGHGVRETGAALGLIVGGLGSLVGSFASPTTPPPVAGPVGIATQIGDIFWGAGPIMTLYVAAILSANLAVVNVLPFPPLDGGRMLMITLKSIFGRRISLRAEQLTYMVGFVFLFAFLIWITGFDILRQVGAVPSPTP